MTNLRVFEDPNKRLLIEISSPTSVLSRGLLVPALPAEDSISKLLNRSETVEVRLEGRLLRVPFMLVLSQPRDRIERLPVIGRLEETDSINVINHILDTLAWP